MKDFLNNFATSGIDFKDNQEHLKARYQTLNVGLVLTSVSLIYGIIGNIIRDITGYIPLEVGIIFVNILLILAMRKYHEAFEYIVVVMVAQFTFLFIFLLYISDPNSMKHAWIFTYPIMLLYLQSTKKSFYWMAFLIAMLMIAPIQNIIEVKYSLFQVSYITAVLIIINSIMYFYQLKMSDANNKILAQQEMLQKFNNELEDTVNEKTASLQELNELLEIKVEEKLEELRAKDKILEVQSKQAVMGEMISMIAHQWRQPLSTITLQIANLQFKKLLGEDLASQDVDDALTEISDTIIYLSDTVDDFQTYFHPDKEMLEVEMSELIQRAINFSKSRIHENAINIEVCKNCSQKITTFPNEFVQVVLNILNNAIDAHNEAKSKNATIDIEIKNEANELVVKISDNAGGIAFENISKLFEPYFSTKGKNGTGLGLYMSQMIVQKQFGGNIEVDSSPKGSIFSIKIPNNT